MAAKYLPLPLESYPDYEVPSVKALVKHYEEALASRRDGNIPSEGLLKGYSSKVGGRCFDFRRASLP